ncbi:Asp23/Gls24 family envelope stress response protein [Actinocorallia populi]|uniref:Asp23/Gls24 family envelope stress response protein n=1 Tax=Actinocorallia populi TaxID=2079200 RepID=UPI000D089ADA|nr:Asp23/Gls24 family envelope stress response protein [Actinocorallia populi]
MPDLDPLYSANGTGGEHRAEPRSAMPFFPAPSAAPPSAPAGLSGGGSPSAGTLPSPPPLRGEVLPGSGGSVTGPIAQAPPPPPSVPVQAPEAVPSEPAGRATVKGQIRIEDEVVEKIAALAALEVAGVAALGGRREASETMEEVRRRIGDGRAAPGVRALVADDEISLEVALVVEYGSIVIDVARTVKNNVAKNVSTMLGMRVAAVDVTVQDVRMPGEAG